MTFLAWAICVFLAIKVVADSLAKQESDPQNNLDK